MALKLTAQFSLTFSGGGKATGVIVDNAGQHALRINLTPPAQDLTTEDLGRLQEAQGVLKEIINLFQRLTKIELG